MECPTGRYIALPEELLLIIFGYLSIHSKAAVAKVCNRWRFVAYHYSLWVGAEPKLILSTVHNTITVADSLQQRKIVNVNLMAFSGRKSLKRFFLCIGAHLESLNLSFCNLTYSVINECMSLSFTKLLYLDISHTTLSNISLCRLCKSLPHLEQLKLDSFVAESDPYDSWVGFIVSNLKRLNDLDLSHTGISRGGCNQLKINGASRNLKRLCLNGNRRLPTDILEMIELDSLEHLAISFNNHSLLPLSTLKSLVSLRMSNMMCDVLPTIDIISVNLANLTALDISDNYSVTDTAIHTLVCCLPNIAALIISNCQAVTDFGANLIVCNLEELRVLHIDNIAFINGGQFLSNVASHLFSLYSFSCVGCGFAPSVIRSKLSSLNIIYLCFRSPDHIESSNGGAKAFVKDRKEIKGEDYFKPSSSYFC